MKRKDFIKGAGLVSIAAILPWNKKVIASQEVWGSCTPTPELTDGPYPDIFTSTHTISSITRSDITDSQVGIPLTVTFTVVDETSCLPVEGVDIYVWHCNADGYYSEYSQQGYLGTKDYTNAEFLRGIQTTDANGQVTFQTIYPGWYTPRATHIHVRSYINSVLESTTQLCFPDTDNTTVYNTSHYTGHGQNTTKNSTDMVFSPLNSSELTLVTFSVSGNTTNGYTATAQLTIDASVLPLKLISFAAALEGKNVSLLFTTADETNMKSFEIERSSDGYHFSPIGTLNAKNGSGINNYTFTDAAATGTKVYYRLKLISIDGTFTYSSITNISLNFNTRGISIYPNPVHDNLVLLHPKADEATKIHILTIDGKIVSGADITVGTTATTVNVNALNKGAYILLYQSTNEKYITRFVKE
ncbi:MAG: T9SS type A sorting domain-containing protein [Bacteroidetes bacterium]|nr:T9SS type A sorting domain-containing protein [Bacteroidota bacterium]